MPCGHPLSGDDRNRANNLHPIRRRHVSGRRLEGALAAARKRLGLGFRRLCRSGRCSAAGRHLRRRRRRAGFSSHVSHRARRALPRGLSAAGAALPSRKLSTDRAQDKTPSARVDARLSVRGRPAQQSAPLYIYFSAPMSRGEAARTSMCWMKTAKSWKERKRCFFPAKNFGTRISSGSR